jgi:hypothetical protein
MARAQELLAGMGLGNGKWSWWCHTHFVMAGGHGKSKIKYTNLIVKMDRLPDPPGSHIKQPMFYPHDWDLAFYGILQMHSVHFKQPMFYILEWVLVVYHIL